MNDEQVKGSIWTSWVLPLVIFFGLVAVFGAALSESMDIPLLQACAWMTVFVLGLGGYFFAEFWLYAAACRRLRYRCEMRPQPKPRSARFDADIVITGTSRGAPFTLYRERHNSRSTSASSALRASSPVISSIVEWADEAIPLPDFTLQVASSSSALAAPERIQVAVMNAVSAARGRKERDFPSGGFDTSTTLGGRSTLSASDEGAARAALSRTVCEALDPLIGVGSVEGAPGLLVLREQPSSALWTSRTGKFPYPWEIDKYLEHADQVRRILVSGSAFEPAVNDRG